MSEGQRARPGKNGARGTNVSRGGPARRTSRDTAVGSFEVLDLPRETVARRREVFADVSPSQGRPRPTVARRGRQQEGSRSSSQGFSRDSADTVIRVRVPASPGPRHLRPQGSQPVPVTGPGSSRRPSVSAPGGPRPATGEAAAGRDRGAPARVGPPVDLKPSPIRLRVEEVDPMAHPSVTLTAPAPFDATPGSQLTVGGFSRENSAATVVPAAPAATPEDLAGLLRLSMSHGTARERSFFAGLSASGSFAHRPESRQTVSTTLSDRAVFTTGLAGFLGTADSDSRTPSLASLQTSVRSSGGADGAGVGQDTAAVEHNASREGVDQGRSVQRSSNQQDTGATGGDVRDAMRPKGSVRVEFGQGNAVRPGDPSLTDAVRDSAREVVADSGRKSSDQKASVPGDAVQGRRQSASRGEADRGSTSIRVAVPGSIDQDDAAGLGSAGRRMASPATSVTSRWAVAEAVTLPGDAELAAVALGGHGDVGRRTSIAGGDTAPAVDLQHGEERVGRDAPSGDAALPSAATRRVLSREQASRRASSTTKEPLATNTGDGADRDRRQLGGTKGTTTATTMGTGDAPAMGTAGTASSPEGRGPSDTRLAPLWQVASVSRSTSAARGRGGGGGGGAGGLSADKQERRHVDHVSVREGKAFVVQPSSPTPPVSLAGLRRSRSAVFSLKPPPHLARPVAGPTGPGPARATDPGVQALIDHIDTVLPKGLRDLLLQLENHCDLGVMALYAATLHRHRRLSSALRHLQEPARTQEKAAKSNQPTRVRWGRWRRGLLLRAALKPSTPPPPPPLPPNQRPDLFAIERYLQDALKQGLAGVDEGRDDGDRRRTGATRGPPQTVYNETWTADACRILAAYVTRATAKLDPLKRYKTACVVRIIEKRQQRFSCHFAALWNSDCDGFCSVVHETETLVAHALFMLVYWD